MSLCLTVRCQLTQFYHKQQQPRKQHKQMLCFFLQTSDAMSMSEHKRKFQANLRGPQSSCAMRHKAH